MNCNDAINLLHAYLDKQLDVNNSIDIEHHLSACPNCQQAYSENEKNIQRINEKLPYYTAPDDLRKKIISQYSTSPACSTKINPNLFKFKYGLSFAASLLIGFILAFSYFQFDNDHQLISAVLSSHISALTANHPTDIEINNAEDLTPWFATRLNYSPKVFDFNKQGYTLTGGRLDSLNSQNIAAITYQYKHKLINVYTWPSPDIDDAEQEFHKKQGYNIIYWCKHNMNYWIVSDGNNENITELANLIQQRLKE